MKGFAAIEILLLEADEKQSRNANQNTPESTENTKKKKVSRDTYRDARTIQITYQTNAACGMQGMNASRDGCHIHQNIKTQSTRLDGPQ